MLSEAMKSVSCASGVRNLTHILLSCLSSLSAVPAKTRFLFKVKQEEDLELRRSSVLSLDTVTSWSAVCKASP